MNLPSKIAKKTDAFVLLLVSSYLLFNSYLPGIYASLQTPTAVENTLKIEQIVVHGTKHTTTPALLKRLPYKEGDVYDEHLSSQAIQLVYALGYFSKVSLEKELLPNNRLRLHLFVEEKKLLNTISFHGNSAINKTKLKEKIHYDKLTTMDDGTALRLIDAIKKLYREENYHTTEVSYTLKPVPNKPDMIDARFTLKEGPKSSIIYVNFKGNTVIPARKLRKVIFTRESWLLGFVDESGKYDQTRLDEDKHRLEYFYRDHGYLMAKVVGTTVHFSPDKQTITVTFEIKEGERYEVGSVSAVTYAEMKEAETLKHVSLEPGQYFSQSKLIEAINKIKHAWGLKGYIYADVYPQVRPNASKKTVDITFHCEHGKKMFVNRITITGNRLTRDKVIRREILFQEGDLLTTDMLNNSQKNVEFLSYFERDGVNWKIHRITETSADVELNVKETKTGRFQFSATYGSDKYSSQRSLKGVIECSRRNLFGLGIDMQALLQGNRKKFQRFQFQIFDPYLFDTNISGGFDLYVRREEYDTWQHVKPTPIERTSGAIGKLGFTLPSIDNRLHLYQELGIESITNNKPKAASLNAETIQPIINRIFQNGTLLWLQSDLVYDTRNHKIYPNQGYKISTNTKLALPGINREFSFIKSEFDASWYTSLIDDDRLVLALHARTGFVRRLSSGTIIPYKELFHMGGQSTVRGFVWGSIGPALLNNPVGGQNMVLFNAELLFPLLDDYSMKAHFFYDAGAGWNTPKHDIPDITLLKRDKFNLRHSIGFGINLMYPQAIKIDWGYKLDRDKAAHESPSEWHISMNMAW